MVAVLTILRNATALTDLLNNGANGIYVGQALDTDASPYVVIVPRILEVANSSDSGASNVMYEYNIYSFAHDFTTVNSVATCVKNALDVAQRQTIGGEYLQYCRLENQEIDSLKEDNIDYFMAEQRFEAFITT